MGKVRSKKYSGTAHTTEKEEQAAQIRHLKAELRRVTEERDILKKASAYFADQSE